VTDVFVYGTLCHEPLLSVVIGRLPDRRDATLPGYVARAVPGASFPVLVRAEGTVSGHLLRGLTGDEFDRLEWYEDGFRAQSMPVRLTGSGETVAATVFHSSARMTQAQSWDFADWQGRWGATVTRAAIPFMRAYDTAMADRVRLRYPQLLTRAGASERAGATPGPTVLRRKSAPGDIAEAARREPYAAYFAVEEYDLSFRRFDGGMSGTVTRAVFISGDAAVVLPYDPAGDRVLLIEQWRAGPYARGDRECWLIETVAGRIDGGETPEEAARREAQEEAGIALGALLPAGNYYPSPAAKGEYIYGFVGLADLSGTGAGFGGLDSESEDIRIHVVSFAQLMALVDSGEIDNGPLLILARWLDVNRAAIRARLPSGA
jgi:ADP-ribose pyrophosphatase